jgi:hypothetical protein
MSDPAAAWGSDNGYAAAPEELATATPQSVPCTLATLHQPHPPHDWELQPGMNPVPCPGYGCTQQEGLCAEHGYHRRPPAADDLRQLIAHELHAAGGPFTNADAETLADAVIAAIQGLYVPPPPGSDRDALPEDLRVLIAPHMPEYVSTTCQVALALDRASTIHLPSMVTLMDWERRQHAACRLTRKQDMARCVCDCHTGRPVVPAVETDPADGFTGL